MIVTISTSLQANILLDNNFHCQIADFGLARHSDITATRSTTALSFNFAAPELLGACIICRVTRKMIALGVVATALNGQRRQQKLMYTGLVVSIMR